MTTKFEIGQTAWIIYHENGEDRPTECQIIGIKANLTVRGTICTEYKVRHHGNHTPCFHESWIYATKEECENEINKYKNNN